MSAIATDCTPNQKKQVLIGGRVDAIATCDGQQILVEIKNRMKRFFAEVPLYEKVQTQVKGKILKALRY